MTGGAAISVIVPFFNVADCVAYCLASVLGQTLGDFEVICVDDGSTDATGELLDAVARMDGRVRVVHTANGGLSAARNAGVAVATGDFVTFVDGDDFVSPFYLEHLAQPVLSGVVEASIGTCVRIDRAKAESWRGWKAAQDYEVCRAEEAVERMLYNRPMISSWAHLAPRAIYEASPFAEGRLYEDSLAFAAHVACFSSIAFLREPVYGYVIRAESITDYTSVDFEQARQFRAMQKALRDDVEGLGGDFGRALMFHEALEDTRLYRMLRRVEDGGPQSRALSDECVRYVRSSLPVLLRDRGVKRADKARLLLFGLAPSIYPSVLALAKRAQAAGRGD